MINAPSLAKILLSHLRYGGKVILKRKFPRSFRIVDMGRKEEVLESLRREGFEVKELSFCPGACLALDGKKPLGSSIMNFFGYIYIQDLSSMLPPVMLRPSFSSLVLDMCASPGGKTAILSHIVGDKGSVIANEPNPKRNFTLQKNIERMNLLNVSFTSYSGEDFPLIDRGGEYILADVPCSGWGTVQKNPQVLKLWRGKRLDGLISLQRRILARSIFLLMQDGRLLYSTCTTNHGENEQQILWALEEFEVEIEPLEPPEGFYCEEVIGGALMVKGDKYGSQAFFLCALKKTRTETGGVERIKTLFNRTEEIDRRSFEIMLEREGFSLDHFPGGRFYREGRKIFFLGGTTVNTLDRKGIFIGEVRGEKFSPNLSLRKLFSPDFGNKVVLETEEEVEGLIQGKSFPIRSRDKFVKLYLRDLPLTLLRVKGHRCLLSR